MKTYGDLDLKKIREDNGLDFAHYTYGRGQCSCCFGPLDMAKKYWHNNTIPSEYEESSPNLSPEEKEKATEHFTKRDFTYILFKNADNGRGRIKSKAEPIKNHTCISYVFESEEQKINVCRDLQSQLGDDYRVTVPADDMTCIVIELVS